MQKPISVTVFGILNLLFGTLGLCCTPIGLLMQFVSVPASSQSPIEGILNAPEMRVFNLVLLSLTMIASVVLVASGLALLYAQPWGRTLAIGYGIYAILSVVVSGVLQAVYMYPPLMELARKTTDPAVKGAVTLGLLGGAIGSCFGLLYPVLLLIFMNRANVKAYFGAAAPTDVLEQPLHPSEEEIQQPYGEPPAPQ